MKVEVTENKKEKEIEFPCLMYYSDNGMIIFVTKRNDRTVSGFAMAKASQLGHYSDSWTLDQLTPFNGTITLSND